MSDPNTPTGCRGLIAVDKVGGHVLFLDPRTYETIAVIDHLPPRPHELAITPDRKTALVPIYGDGIHGNNPHPGHTIALIDLAERRHVGDIDLSPRRAPHGLQWTPDGRVWCVCEESGVVVALDVAGRRVNDEIAVGSRRAHRIAVLPDGSKLYTENEEDPFASMLDLTTLRLVAEIPMRNGTAGLAAAPDGARVVYVDAKEPVLVVVDTRSDRVVQLVDLPGHTKPAQIARFSPDGRFLVVTSYEAPLATIFDGDLTSPRTIALEKGPMNMAFHPDRRTVLIADHDAGLLSVVDLERATVERTVTAGRGIETLSFF